MPPTSAPQKKDRLSLYGLSEEALAFDELVSMDEGEWTPEHEALHTELAVKMMAKADSYGMVYRNIETARDALKAESARMAKRAKTLDASLERIERLALMALQTMKRDSVAGDLFTLSIRKNAPVAKWVADTPLDPENLPDEFVKVNPATRQPVMGDITAALKQGREVAGFALRGSISLSIR